MTTDTLFEILGNQLREDEGLRLKPYQDSVGILTIGYGRNLEQKGISKTEAEFLMSNDIRDAIAEAKKLFPKFDQLSIPRQSVICNMIFNLGLTKFLTFKKFIACVQDGSFTKAASEMLDSAWANQVGHRADYLSILMEQG